MQHSKNSILHKFIQEYSPDLLLTEELKKQESFTRCQSSRLQPKIVQLDLEMKVKVQTRGFNKLQLRMKNEEHKKTTERKTYNIRRTNINERFGEMSKTLVVELQQPTIVKCKQRKAKKMYTPCSTSRNDSAQQKDQKLKQLNNFFWIDPRIENTEDLLVQTRMVQRLEKQKVQQQYYPGYRFDCIEYKKPQKKITKPFLLGKNNQYVWPSELSTRSDQYK